MVGIFWHYRNEVIGWRCADSAGEVVGHMIDSPENHYTFWPTLQRRRPELRGLEYEDVPRGRVLFDTMAQRPHVLLNQDLLGLATRKRVCAFFDLPLRKTKFLADEHYTTDPDELSRLFDT